MTRIAATLAVALAAAGAVDMEAAKRACQGDALKHCASEIFSGHDAIAQCLYAKRDGLSSACRNFMKKVGNGKS
jgi:hypothetical protein